MQPATNEINDRLLRRCNKKRTLFLDWDGTLTPGCTLGLIASIRPSAPPLDSFTEAYEADLAQHEAKWRGNATLYEVNNARCAAGLRAVELASIRRLETAGIWAGVTGPALRTEQHQQTEQQHQREQQLLAKSRPGDKGPIDVEDAAYEAVARGEVRLRPGVIALLRAAIRHGDYVVVISLSWSGTWIAACLSALGIPAVSAAVRVPAMHGGLVQDRVVVVANEIDPSGSGRLSRGLTSFGKGHQDLRFDAMGDIGLFTNRDKLEVVRLWTRSLGRDTSTVAMGDSLGDLFMLLFADEAFVVSDRQRIKAQRELDWILKRLKRTVRDIKTYAADETPRADGKSLLQDKPPLRVIDNLWPVVEYLYGPKAGVE